LHAEFQVQLHRFKGRPVVTFHDAFPYLTRRYGLELVGVIEEVPNVEPSARYLANLLKTIRATKVDLLFTEPQFNPLLAERLAKDLGVRLASLDTLETGEASADFYEAGMRRNLRTLVENLR
jgi:ABC-type Zn uptake system ZnuABC Zn-binding protein ZnuA